MYIKSPKHVKCNPRVVHTMCLIVPVWQITLHHQCSLYSLQTNPMDESHLSFFHDRHPLLFICIHSFCSIHSNVTMAQFLKVRAALFKSLLDINYNSPTSDWYTTDRYVLSSSITTIITWQMFFTYIYYHSPNNPNLPLLSPGRCSLPQHNYS